MRHSSIPFPWILRVIDTFKSFKPGWSFERRVSEVGVSFPDGSFTKLRLPSKLRTKPLKIGGLEDYIYICSPSWDHLGPIFQGQTCC